MKVNELSGALLDYWVARARGMSAKIYAPSGAGSEVCVAENRMNFCPSTDWAQGGPIIERERMHGGPAGGQSWFYQCHRKNSDGTSIPYPCGESGSTPLIAAMRAYVASKFGDEVPDDLAAPQEDKQ